MQFKSRLKITAAKRFNDTIDGTHHDTTTVFYEVNMPDNDDHIGSVVEPIKWGTSANLTKLKDMLKGVKPPFYAECTLEQVSTGKRSTLILIDLVPEISSQTNKPA